MRTVVEVITAGETMGLGTPAQPGRLRHATNLELKIGGAESDVAIALSRLGISTGWVSFLGDDEPGQLVLDHVRAEGVDTSRVRRSRDSFTGLYLRERLGTGGRVYRGRGAIPFRPSDGGATQNHPRPPWASSRNCTRTTNTKIRNSL